ncbi:hypothetical protein CLOM_g23992 [Closterium sp. NIES-68]|nr:hypothetical protein CLOM_g23992 [Closterium sp. NIES-68]GJP84020.1 hypothetical protein CLOP_g14112 [Closterium sp. NIES-67]
MSIQVAAAAAAADVQNRPSRIPNVARAAGPIMAMPRQPIVVDREKTCPLLLRVFTKHGGHHDLDVFAVRGQEPKEEVQMYTWKDATLRELTDLLKEVVPEARRRDARLSFAFVYPNRQGRNVMKQAGITNSMTRRPTPDDNRTLQELGFQTGDFLDVAIFS